VTATKVLRCVGGPMHDELIAIDVHRHVVEVLMPPKAILYNRDESIDPTEVIVPRQSFYQQRKLAYDQHVVGHVLIFENSPDVGDFALRMIETIWALAYLCVPEYPAPAIEVLRRRGLFKPVQWKWRLDFDRRWFEPSW
jgi:hypothetical protein